MSIDLEMADTIWCKYAVYNLTHFWDVWSTLGTRLHPKSASI